MSEPTFDNPFPHSPQWSSSPKREKQHYPDTKRENLTTLNETQLASIRQQLKPERPKAQKKPPVRRQIPEKKNVRRAFGGKDDLLKEWVAPQGVARRGRAKRAAAHPPAFCDPQNASRWWLEAKAALSQNFYSKKCPFRDVTIIPGKKRRQWPWAKTVHQKSQPTNQIC